MMLTLLPYFSLLIIVGFRRASGEGVFIEEISEDSPEIKPRDPQICETGPLDLIFLIDGSSSIFPGNFSRTLQLVDGLIRHLDVHMEGVRVGLIQFNRNPKREFSLKHYQMKQQLLDELGTVHYQMGVTYLGKALGYVVEKEFTEERGDRPDVKNVLVVISDGLAQDDLDEPLRAIHSSGIDSFAVGVTNHAWNHVLLEVANQKQDHVIQSDVLIKYGVPTAIKRLLEAFGGKDCYVEGADTTGGSGGGGGSGSGSGSETGGDGSGGDGLVVIEDLEVSCGDMNIQVTAKSERPFTGRVYAKGYFKDDGCRTEFAGNTNKLIHVMYELNSCGMKKDRSPAGIYISVTIIFMSHPKLLTKFDRAYRVQCFYMQTDKTVQSELGVSMINTETLTTNAMPSCVYTLRLNSPDGPLATFATVGSKIYHKWDCDAPGTMDVMFGMKVHSCYARDGQKNNVLILGEDGCALDKYVMQELTYAENLTTAYVETHVFKFADIQDILFDCQIAICVKEMCEGKTPPSCSGSGRGRRETGLDALLAAENDDSSLVVSSPKLEVLEIQFFNESLNEPSRDSSESSFSHYSRPDQVCMSRLMVAGSAVLYVLVLCVGLVLPLIGKFCLNRKLESL